MFRRPILATVLFPLVSIAVATAVLVSIGQRLPDEVAVGWGWSGEPDRFVRRGAVPILFAGWSLVMVGLFAAIAHAIHRSVAGRAMLGLPGALVWFLAGLMGATTIGQIDAAGRAEFSGWAILVALVSGAVGWFVALRLAGPPAAVAVTHAPAPSGAPRAELGPGETAVWVGRTPPARLMLVIAAAVFALAVGVGAVASWWMLAILVPVAGLVAASSVYRVTVGRRMIDISGLALGYPRLRIPLDQISAASAGTVDAWSFGGWGIRVGHGGETAVLTRSGPALVVTRTDGAVVRVSLDEPGDAAAVVNSLMDRRR